MKILLKFPIRQRVNQFLNTLKLYADYCENPDNVTLIVSLDEDDEAAVKIAQNGLHPPFKNYIFAFGEPQGKIAAVNRDVHLCKDWDILVLASDDMIPQVQGWDTILINEMAEHFPDTDGVLFHNDGYIGRRLNTMCILGRKYYERFGYIYHPSYKSLWCDNEFMEVADKLCKQDYFDLCLFKHEHFSTNQSVKPDALMKHNQKFFYLDKANYERRKRRNFDL